MADLQYAEFSEEPSVYTICTNPASNTGVSCIIVEDDPGPYLSFLSEIAVARACRLTMTAPFAESTLRLLQGEEVVFGPDGKAPKVRIPDLARCVVILDMRNETPQSFPGYDSKRFDTAGYQFFLQLRGFPGKVFFATRYGRAKFDEMGIFGPFGVVPLSIKAGFHKALPGEDKQKIQGALDNALILCDVHKINAIALDGAGCRVTFKGEVSTVPANAQERALLELIKDGGKGLTDEDLCERIGYRPRHGETDERAQQFAGERSCEGDGDDSTDALAGASDESEADEGASGHPARGGLAGLRVDRNEKDGFGVSDHRGQAETITAKEREAARDAYNSVKAQLAHVKAEVRKAEQKLAKAQAARDALLDQCKKKVSAMFGGSVPDPRELVEEDREKLEALREQIAEQTRDAARSVVTLEQALEEKKGDLRQTQTTRDELYRRGYKSRKNDVGMYVVPRESSKPADYVRKLKDRLLQDLRNPKYCYPPPTALIAHIEESIVRIDGTNKYIGKDVWRI